MKMLDIITETINRIRLSDMDLMILFNVFKKINIKDLTKEELKFYKIFIGRLEGRIKLKKSNPEL